MPNEDYTVCACGHYHKQHVTGDVMDYDQCEVYECACETFLSVSDARAAGGETVVGERGTVTISGYLGYNPDWPFPPLFLRDGRVVRCPYESCEGCDGCGVCGGFHGRFVGSCKEGSCPNTWWRKLVDWVRRLWWRA